MTGTQLAEPVGNSDPQGGATFPGDPGLTGPSGPQGHSGPTSQSAPAQPYVVSLTCEAGGIYEVAGNANDQRATSFFTVSLDREIAAGDGPITVTLSEHAAGPDTAKAARYIINDAIGVIFQPGGPTSRRIRIQAVNNNLVDGNQIVRLKINAPDQPSQWVIGANLAAITIYDNDYWAWDSATLIGQQKPNNKVKGQSGNFKYEYDHFTHSFMSSDVACAVHAWGGMDSTERRWWGDTLWSVAVDRTVGLKLDDAGMISATVDGKGKEQHGSTAAAIGVAVDINNGNGDAVKRDALVTFRYNFGINYSYTEKNSLDGGLEGEGAVAGFNVDVGYEVSQTMAGGFTVEREISYRVNASVHER